MNLEALELRFVNPPALGRFGRLGECSPTLAPRLCRGPHYLPRSQIAWDLGTNPKHQNKTQPMKVIQIAATPETEEHYSALFILLDDGRMYQQYLNPERDPQNPRPWQPIAPPFDPATPHSPASIEFAQIVQDLQTEADDLAEDGGEISGARFSELVARFRGWYLRRDVLPLLAYDLKSSRADNIAAVLAACVAALDGAAAALSLCNPDSPEFRDSAADTVEELCRHEPRIAAALAVAVPLLAQLQPAQVNP